MNRMAILLFSLLPSIAWAADCNADCKIKRGDANCSGWLTFADVQAILDGNFTNWDAADVNDDGDVDISDAVYLNSYLNNPQGSPMPKCPFPQKGLDCTPDNLEIRCSPPDPPLGPQTELEATSCNGQIENSATVPWGEVQRLCLPAAGVSFLESTSQNFFSCSTQRQVSDTWFTSIAVADGTGFMRKRLQNDVQNAYLFMSLEAFFQVTNACPDSICDGSNTIYATPTGFNKVEIGVKPKGGGATVWFEKLVSFDTLLFTYTRIPRPGQPGQCDLVLHDNPEQLNEIVIEITDDLAAIPSSDDQEWVIADLRSTLGKIRHEHFAGTHDDIAQQEEVRTVIGALFAYTWCPTCGP